MAYRKLNLRYDSKCGFCLKPKPAGKEAYYDPETSRICCHRCYTKVKDDPETAFLNAQRSTLQSLIDEYARHPNAAILTDMAQRHDIDELAAKFLRDRSRFAPDRNYVLIEVKWPKRCRACDTMLAKQSWAIWQAQSHHIWCLACAVDSESENESAAIVQPTSTSTSEPAL